MLWWVMVDFGVDTLVKLTQKTRFPWLLSNVRDVKTERPLAEAVTSHVITWQGRKVSFTLNSYGACLDQLLIAIISSLIVSDHLRSLLS